MRIIRIVPGIAAAIMIGGLSVPAMSTAQQSAADSAQEEDVPSTRAVICRREPPPAGSRIGGRNICKTEREWAILERERTDTMENVGLRSRFGNEDANSNCGPVRQGC